MHDAHHLRISETSVVQGFPANLTNVDVGGACVFRNPISMHRVAVAISVARAPTLLHQHFLKPDTVFFNVLVYSE
jgi:hypothetical protein